MTKVRKSLLFLGMILMIMISACSRQAETVIPSTQSISTVASSSTQTRTPSMTASLTPTPTITASPTLTPTLSYMVHPLPEALPSGQYVAYIEACDPASADQPCNLNAISTDSSIKVFLAKIPFNGRSASNFTFRMGRIAYTIRRTVANDERLPSAIQVFDIDNDQVFEVPVSDQRNCETEDWSPDGTQLVVLCQEIGGNWVTEIALLSVLDGKFTILLNHQNQTYPEYGYEQPRWSPDGKWLLFYDRNLCGGCQAVEKLYVTDMSCVTEPPTCQAKTRQLTFPLHTRTISGWTSDSRLFRAQNNQIEIYAVKGQQRLRTIQVNLSDDQIRSAIWSPDRKWIVITWSDSPGISLLPSQGGKMVSPVIGEYPFWLTIP